MDIQPTTFKKMILVSQEYLTDLEDFKRNYMQGYTENNGNNSNMQVDDEVYAENEDENLNQQSMIHLCLKLVISVPNHIAKKSLTVKKTSVRT